MRPRSMPAMKDALGRPALRIAARAMPTRPSGWRRPARWPSPARRPPSCCCPSAWPRSRATPRCAPRCARALDHVDGRLAWGERAGRGLHRRQPGLDPAAGGPRPGHHLRPDGRDQHGARRADDDRRLRHLRGAEPVPQPTCPAPSTATCWWRSRSSFLAAAAVGAVLERGVIRWLYGRPLETLLATWGISLILMQAVRTSSARRTCRWRTPPGCPAAWR